MDKRKMDKQEAELANEKRPDDRKPSNRCFDRSLHPKETPAAQRS